VFLRRFYVLKRTNYFFKNFFFLPFTPYFQYEIEGTPVGGESSEQRRARKKANTQRKERVELRAGAKKGYLPSIEKFTEKKNIKSARKAAERAAAPAEVTEARKLQDSAQHAAKRAAAPASHKSNKSKKSVRLSQKSTRHNTAENAVAPRECGCYLCTHFGPTIKK
jgi:hypothetical protein